MLFYKCKAIKSLIQGQVIMSLFKKYNLSSPQKRLLKNIEKEIQKRNKKNKTVYNQHAYNMIIFNMINKITLK